MMNQEFPEDEAWSGGGFRQQEATNSSDCTPPFEPRSEEPGHSVAMSTLYTRLAFHDEGGLGEVFLRTMKNSGGTSP